MGFIKVNGKWTHASNIKSNKPSWSELLEGKNSSLYKAWEKATSMITARIQKDKVGVWLIIEGHTDSENVAVELGKNQDIPLMIEEVSAIEDACREYLRINQKEEI